MAQPGIVYHLGMAVKNFFALLLWPLTGPLGLMRKHINSKVLYGLTMISSVTLMALWGTGILEDALAFGGEFSAIGAGGACALTVALPGVMLMGAGNLHQHETRGKGRAQYYNHVTKKYRYEESYDDEEANEHLKEGYEFKRTMVTKSNYGRISKWAGLGLSIIGVIVLMSMGCVFQGQGNDAGHQISTLKHLLVPMLALSGIIGLFAGFGLFMRVSENGLVQKNTEIRNADAVKEYNGEVEEHEREVEERRLANEKKKLLKAQKEKEAELLKAQKEKEAERLKQENRVNRQKIFQKMHEDRVKYMANMAEKLAHQEAIRENRPQKGRPELNGQQGELVRCAPSQL